MTTPVEAIKRSIIDGKLHEVAKLAAAQHGLKQPPGEGDPLTCAYFIRYAYVEAQNRHQTLRRSAEDAQDEARVWKQAHDAAMHALTGREQPE